MQHADHVNQVLRFHRDPGTPIYCPEADELSGVMRSVLSKQRLEAGILVHAFFVIYLLARALYISTQLPSSYITRLHIDSNEILHSFHSGCFATCHCKGSWWCGCIHSWCDSLSRVTEFTDTKTSAAKGSQMVTIQQCVRAEEHTTPILVL
jgi:hypothetical protein